MKPTKSVAGYIEDAAESWRPLLDKLRKILQSSGLEETIKWGAPCYTLDGKNVVGIAAFKAHVALWFHQGALLDDPEGVLINAQEGRTRGLRQWCFTTAKEVKVAQVRRYVARAVALAKEGKAITPRAKPAVPVPPELKQALAKSKTAAAAFAKLSPSCRREYSEYVAEAKRDETKQRRVAKILPMIRAAKGLNDKYK